MLINVRHEMRIRNGKYNNNNNNIILCSTHNIIVVYLLVGYVFSDVYIMR